MRFFFGWPTWQSRLSSGAARRHRCPRATGGVIALLTATSCFALECAPGSPLVAFSKDWPAYEAYVLEITPIEGRAVDWTALRAPGLLVRARAEVESQPAAYASDLFMASMPESSVVPLTQDAQRQGTISVFGPIPLSAPWGRAATYRQTKAFSFVKTTTTNQKGLTTRTELSSENIVLDIQSTGYPGADGTMPETEIQLAWQQVTGWLTQNISGTAVGALVTPATTPPRELPSRHEKTITHVTEPTLVRSKMTHCARLPEGEALFFGGIQGLMMAADGVSDTYREMAVIVRKTPR